MSDIQIELTRFKKDTAYYVAHQEELLDQYPERWVAIYNERVVGSSPDAEQLFEDLEKKGVPIERALFKHLTRKEELLILLS